MFLPHVPRNARAWIEIDHAALSRNVRRICSLLSPRTKLMAILKADAYGHGAVSVAPTILLGGAAALGVATLEEGIALRQSGISQPILVLGYVDGEESVAALAHYQLTPTICSAAHARAFAACLADGLSRGPLPAERAAVDVHLKLDTGMTRLGQPWKEADALARELARIEMLRVTGAYSHLASADSPDPHSMRVQQRRFEAAVKELCDWGCQPGCLHLANSAATLTDPAYHYDMVRVGIALYGVYPASHLRDRVRLEPALSIRSRITQIKEIAAGSGVSYGSRFVADRPTRVAVVSIGYGDGVPFRLSQRMKVLLRGRLIPQLGRITMDQIMLDVSCVPEAQSGDIVTLLGRDGDVEISVEDWALALDTIPWEVLCLFKSRLPRVDMGRKLAPRPSQADDAEPLPMPKKAPAFV